MHSEATLRPLLAHHDASAAQPLPRPSVRPVAPFQVMLDREEFYWARLPRPGALRHAAFYDAANDDYVVAAVAGHSNVVLKVSLLEDFERFNGPIADTALVLARVAATGRGVPGLLAGQLTLRAEFPLWRFRLDFEDGLSRSLGDFSAAAVNEQFTQTAPVSRAAQLRKRAPRVVQGDHFQEWFFCAVTQLAAPQTLSSLTVELVDRQTNQVLAETDVTVALTADWPEEVLDRYPGLLRALAA